MSKKQHWWIVKNGNYIYRSSLDGEIKSSIHQRAPLAVDLIGQSQLVMEGDRQMFCPIACQVSFESFQKSF